MKKEGVEGGRREREDMVRRKTGTLALTDGRKRRKGTRMKKEGVEGSRREREN